MKHQITRRNFLANSVKTGIGCSFIAGTGIPLIAAAEKSDLKANKTVKKGEKQLFVDDVMIACMRGVHRKAHAATKLNKPVLEADNPWEQGEIYDGKRDRRVYIYGTVLPDKTPGTYRMWYNRIRDNYYATSKDGIQWERPNLGLKGNNNVIDLFDFHSPSFIFDQKETDPAKRYKAVGSSKGGYRAAYSADGLNWKLYPKNPVLKTSDTITLAQDPLTGEFLAFYKVHQDPRTQPIARQVYLSVSKDMQDWSEPELVMITDETDHKEARLLEGGMHSEFYNMSAFTYGNQWLGFVTLFRRTGTPKIHKGRDFGQSPDDGPIDVQLVHSRDGRKWERCSDRSPVIPLGPHHYDSASILGLCNSPIVTSNEVWMYYTAMTTTHGGYLPDKVMSIARASWRIDGFASLRAESAEGFVETVPVMADGENLFINAEATKGSLAVEVLDLNKKPIRGYEKSNCELFSSDSIKHQIKWKGNQKLPKGKSVILKFYLKKADLFSYVTE